MKYVIAALGQILGTARAADRAADRAPDSGSAQAAHPARDWSKPDLPTRENLSFGSGNLRGKGNNSFQIVNDTSQGQWCTATCGGLGNLLKTKGNFTNALAVSKHFCAILWARAKYALKQVKITVSLNEMKRKTALALFEMSIQHKQILLAAWVVYGLVWDRAKDHDGKRHKDKRATLGNCGAIGAIAPTCHN